MIYSSIGLELLRHPIVLRQTPAKCVQAYHVFWTVPYFEHYPDLGFKLEDYEIEFAKLSALMWKRTNGPISLITDQRGAIYFKKVGMEDVYDEILVLLPDSSPALDAKKYWAAGKLLALQKICAPCVLLDMDAIVWNPLNFHEDVMTAHSEELNPEVYPDFSFFQMSPRYHWPQWDCTVKPLNTSFLYLSSDSFRKLYVSESLRFMQMERNTPGIGARCMVFAEQRILAMCAAKSQIKGSTLLNSPVDKQHIYTHLWSYKHQLMEDASKAEEIRTLCQQRIHELIHACNL